MRLRQVVLSVAGVTVGLAAAYVGSAQIYHYRRFRVCEKELEAAVRAGKTYGAFLQDPRPDGLDRRVERGAPEALRQRVAIWSHAPERTANLEHQVGRAAFAAVFRFGDMVYVLFFDERDRLQEFICLSN